MAGTFFRLDNDDLYSEKEVRKLMRTYKYVMKICKLYSACLMDSDDNDVLHFSNVLT